MLLLTGFPDGGVVPLTSGSAGCKRTAVYCDFSRQRGEVEFGSFPARPSAKSEFAEAAEHLSAHRLSTSTFRMTPFVRRAALHVLRAARTRRNPSTTPPVLEAYLSSQRAADDERRSSCSWKCVRATESVAPRHQNAWTPWSGHEAIRSELLCLYQCSRHDRCRQSVPCSDNRDGGQRGGCAFDDPGAVRELPAGLDHLRAAGALIG